MRAILTYHSIDSSGSPISIDPVAFRAHVEFLASGVVEVVALRDLANPGAPANGVALTFDDGFVNFETHALPLLADHRLPATLFAVTEYVGGTNAWENHRPAGIPGMPLMNWASLGRAMSRGMEIGAHSRRHPDLTAVDAAALDDEVAGCAGRIFTELGVLPSAFAYPYGRFGPREEKVVRGAFERACTTEFRPFQGEEVPLRLPRLDAYYFRESGQLEAWGSAGFRRRLWLRAQGRRVRQLAASVGIAR